MINKNVINKKERMDINLGFAYSSIFPGNNSKGDRILGKGISGKSFMSHYLIIRPVALINYDWMTENFLSHEFNHNLNSFNCIRIMDYSKFKLTSIKDLISIIKNIYSKIEYSKFKKFNMIEKEI